MSRLLQPMRSEGWDRHQDFFSYCLHVDFCFSFTLHFLKDPKVIPKCSKGCSRQQTPESPDLAGRGRQTSECKVNLVYIENLKPLKAVKTLSQI